MQKVKTAALCFILALCLAACGGGGETPAAPPAATPAPTPAPTPEPTPTPAPVAEVILDGESADEILALADNAALVYVDGRGSAEYDALLELSRLRPDCRVEWVYPLCGLDVDSAETGIVFEESDPVDAAGLLSGLAYLPNLERVDLSAHDMDEADMAVLTEAYPDIFFVWMVSFGRWTVRSDITCFSTLQWWPVAYRWNDEDLYPLLHYCTELRALDLGHNDLRDLTPLAGMKELQVLILVDNPNLTDASPIGELEKLEYLEFYMNPEVKDFSFLYSLVNLRDVNISYAPISSLDFLDLMPNLRLAWVGFCPLSWDEITAAREKHPEATIMNYYNGSTSSTSAGWRASESNLAIRKAFTNWQNVVNFVSWDQVEYRPDAVIYGVQPTYEDG